MSPVGISTASSVRFQGMESKYGYKSGQIQNKTFLDKVDSWEGASKAKKIAFWSVLGLLAAGVVAHKLPVNKLPKAVQPAMEKVQSFTKMAVDKAKGLFSKFKAATPNSNVANEAKLQITEYSSPQIIYLPQ